MARIPTVTITIGDQDIQVTQRYADTFGHKIKTPKAPATKKASADKKES